MQLRDAGHQLVVATPTGLPSVNTPRGVGVAGLALVGGGTRHLQLAANVGALIDYQRERGILYGVDFAYEVGEHWSVLSNFSAAYYFGKDPQQLMLDVDGEYRPTQRLAFSLLAIAGLVRGGQARGLFGVSDSFQGRGKERHGASVQAPQPN